MIVAVLALAGLLLLVSLVVRLAIALLPLLLPEQNLFAKYGGGAAIVTGGTDGIGLEISRKLIAQGFRVHIVGLRTNRIDPSELPDGCELTHCDLGDRSAVAALCVWTTLNRPALLVHCAGCCVPSPFTAVRNPAAYIEAHVSSLVELTFAFLRARSSRGGIVFFSSQVSFWSSPFAALYAATKSFTSQFANSISAECPTVDVLCLAPGAVNQTSFFNRFPVHWYFSVVRSVGQLPETVASIVFRAMGKVRLLDTGILTVTTRMVAALVDDNIVNRIGQCAVGSLRTSQQFSQGDATSVSC
jgi:short-subunit dehydrogenase